MPATLFAIMTGIQVSCLIICLAFNSEHLFYVCSHVLLYLVFGACELNMVAQA